ncbi:hypothetical protein RRSWK_01401 [Rhodopirellula sp. SWK7]|nr:hypothetical protein RRSWK_01401 [Rhodopirellula sp. SWK7]
MFACDRDANNSQSVFSIGTIAVCLSRHPNGCLIPNVLKKEQRRPSLGGGFVTRSNDAPPTVYRCPLADVRAWWL